MSPKHANQASLFDGSPEPTVICRSGPAKEPIEWQADFFSSCLLMPRHLVHQEWQERLGRTRPLLVAELRPNDRVMMRAESKSRSVASQLAAASPCASFLPIRTRCYLRPHVR